MTWPVIDSTVARMSGRSSRFSQSTDEQTQTLAFNVLPEDAAECRLFDDLHEMIAGGSPELKRVDRAVRSPDAAVDV